LLLIATPVGEGVTGILLLLAPAVVLRLLIGIESAGDDLRLVARLAGAALVAIGLICGANRSEHRSAPAGLLPAILVYDIAAATLLAYAGLALNRVGIALWPAVLLHAALAAWCIVCLASRLSRTP